ncbi:MAG: hypothetical protein K6C95_07385 [Lachnospiraceae bacterium]|nr:hypothetical protein [Lachnospiraceae bacterium]
MSDPWYILVVIVGILFVFALFGNINERRYAAQRRKRLADAYGQRPGREYSPEEIARLPRYFEKHRDSEPYVIDDITAADLDIYDLFARVNYCRSAAGEEVLYNRLRSPSYRKEELDELEKEICLYTTDSELRLDLQMLFTELGGSGKFSVYDYLDNLSAVTKKSLVPHIIGIAAVIGAAVLTAVNVTVGFIPLIIICLYQVVTYYREKAECDAYLSTFVYILRLIICGEKAAKRLKNIPLSEAAAALKPFAKGAGVLVGSARTSGSGNPLDIFADYLRILLHLDLIKFRQMINELGKHGRDIDRLITLLGNIETAISISCYRASLSGESGYSVPDLREGDDISLDVRDLRHVLIEDGAVTNSMTVDRSILITGANASGKSTWLKALGLCALMAQTIHTVTAKSYSAPFFRIYSSMALSDNLQGGESYYVVEIRALSRVLTAASDHAAPPVLCFIDEVLRGTNTIERIAASAQILRFFAHERALMFAATHDLELTELLKNDLDNYHFEGELRDSDVLFDYRIKPGPSVTRNAIGLLKRFSYASDITGSAEAMAKRFEETGIWSMDGEPLS